MAYKRQTDRLPIIPADAKEHNVVCHYCIVGCGYKAYTWDVDKQGTTDPAGNKFKVNLAEQQGAETEAWYAPSMYNVVKQDGKDVHIVIKPDKACVVNSGLGSIRGARMAEMSYSPVRNTELQRLTDPMVWRYGQMQPTSWEDALDLVARVTAAVINEQGEDGLFVSAFDHGGAGGGYENTWGTGKLYFGAMKIKNIRIHNRPAYNSEVHATRDMGVGELNNCYEDAELADTIVVVGANPLETQTNYFLNHWVPNLRGTSADKKKAEFGNEAIEPSRIIIVDPRRTVTVNACEIEAGKDRVMHLAINSGTDLALFNAWLTYIADKGWTDKASDPVLDRGLRQGGRGQQDDLGGGCCDHRPDGRSDPPVGGMDRPAEGGQCAAPHDVRLRERPDLGQRQLPHQRRARERRARDRQYRSPGWRLRSPRRPPGGLFASFRRSCRQARGLRRQASDRGQGRRASHLGLRPLQDDAQRPAVQAGLQAAHRHGEGRDVVRALWRPHRPSRGDRGRDQEGRPVLRRRRHHPDQDRPGEPRLAAGRDLWRDEPDVDERRAPDAPHRALHGPARARDAGLPDRGPHRQQPRARVPRTGQGGGRRPLQGLRLEDRGRRLHGRLPRA